MAAVRKMRMKKINPKTLLTVLGEDQIDANEYESLTIENSIATGVEAAEETVCPIVFACFSPSHFHDSQLISVT